MNTFPFSALVGQELLKKGLLVNAVDPSIGGVLLRGEKGWEDEAAVRSFAAPPPKDVVSGCRFCCVRGTLLCDECRAREASGKTLRYESRPVEVVDLALNASEDRVVGSLDLEAALREGSRKFEMGVLGKANGNVLYIDEVNLLDDHVVDVLLRGGVGRERCDAGGCELPPPVAVPAGGYDEPGGGGAPPAAAGPVRVVRGDLGGAGRGVPEVDR